MYQPVPNRTVSYRIALQGDRVQIEWNEVEWNRIMGLDNGIERNWME